MLYYHLRYIKFASNIKPSNMNKSLAILIFFLVSISIDMSAQNVRNLSESMDESALNVIIHKKDIRPRYMLSFQEVNCSVVSNRIYILKIKKVLRILHL
jgi:hypothetical protein